MEASTVQLEINTLLQNGANHKDDIIQTIIPPSESYGDQDESLFSLVKTSIWRKELEHCSTVSKVSKGFVVEEDRIESQNCESSSVIVRGSDAGDFPTEYEVFGLKSDEVPVIGTYVDLTIVPGFKYQVRVLGRNRHLFEGRSLHLQSVGRGYGKRITFRGDSRNHNSNYFYSDTNSEGFGFRITALEVGETFVISQNNSFVAGEGIVKETFSQKEISSTVESDGSIVKHISVHFSCDVKYGSNKHGLLPLCSKDKLEVFGTAIVVKTKGARAVTKTVQQAILPNYGSCVLEFAK